MGIFTMHSNFLKMKEKVFCFYIFKMTVYVGLMTAFITVRDLGPLEKPCELQVIRIVSRLLALSVAMGKALVQLSTAGEQVSSYNITTPFWHCYGFDFSSSKTILFHKGAGMCGGMRRSHAAKNSLDNQMCLPTFSSHATDLCTPHVQINPNNSN